MLIQQQVKIFDIPCILGHIPVKIVLKPADTVEIYPGSHAVFKQTGLVMHSMALEKSHSLICIHTALYNGNLLFHILPHLPLDPVKKFLGQGKIPSHIHKKPLPHGKLHGDLLNLVLAHDLIKCLQHNELGASLISLHTRLLSRGNKFQSTRSVYGLVQFSQFPIHRHQHNIIFVLRLILLGNLQI